MRSRDSLTPPRTLPKAHAITGAIAVALNHVTVPISAPAPTSIGTAHDQRRSRASMKAAPAIPRRKTLPASPRKPLRRWTSTCAHDATRPTTAISTYALRRRSGTSRAVAGPRRRATSTPTTKAANPSRLNSHTTTSSPSDADLTTGWSATLRRSAWITSSRSGNQIAQNTPNTFATHNDRGDVRKSAPSRKA